MTVLILFIAVFFASEAEAQIFCGQGRWINNRWTCQETRGERVEKELWRTQKELRENRQTLKDIQREQEAARLRQRSQPQRVIAVTKPVKKAIEKPVEKPVRTAAPDTIYKRKDANGRWHLSNVQ